MSTQTDIRNALKTLLVSAGVFTSAKIYLGKFDAVSPDKLPMCRIYPEGGTKERDSTVSGYDDTFTCIIEVQAKQTAAKKVDAILEDYDDVITDVIRGDDTLGGVVEDVEVVNASYAFDASTESVTGSVSLTVTCRYYT